MNAKTKQKISLFIGLFCFFLLFSERISSQEQLTNIPTFYINTENNEPIRDKEKYLKGNIAIKSSDPTEELNMALEIRGRGNSTWGLQKKPYRLKLEKKTRLLNLPAKENSWVLLANHGDKTLIRNAVAFKISELVGLEYTPSVRFIDLVLNNEYVGNYMLTDQVEVGDNRVPVESQKIENTELPEISGGYLLELDGFGYSEPVKFWTDFMLIVVKYPKDDKINQQQFDYISNFTKNFEEALFSKNFDDPEKGYRPWVDTESLINWYIACELTGNSDSFWSTYIYKYKNIDKFYFGPLWDYDIAFNNDNRLGDATRKLMRNDAHPPLTWIHQLWKDDWFKQAVYDRWMELLVKDNIIEKLLDYVDATSELIDESQEKNFERWKILNYPIFREQFLFPTYEGGVEYLMSYLEERAHFLTESFEKDAPAPSAIEDLNMNAEVKVYPNPASDRLYIQLPVSTWSKEYVSIEVFSIDGKCLHKDNTSVTKSSAIEFHIPGSIPTGIYILKINVDNKNSYLKKLIIN